MAYDISVLDNFFSDPFSPFTDSCINDIFYQSFQENYSINGIPNPINNNNDNLVAAASSSSCSSSSSPPISNQFENLSLYHITNQNFSNASSDSTSAYAMEVKTEEENGGVPFESITGFCNSFLQRSYSSNSFEDNHNNNNKQSFLFKSPFHNHLDRVLESSPNYWGSEKEVLESSSSSSSAQMRRVCSTGDLQKMKENQRRSVLYSSSSLSAEGCSFMEEPNLKVGRYSAEERKERIHRYRAKRIQRNFNKTIKYACRKTLADSRPRIRGRFARNDEAVEIPKTAMFNRYEDEDDLWIDGYNEEEDMGRTPFYSSYGSTTTQSHYHQYFSY